MKNIHKSLLSLLIGIVASYLISSYIVGSFDISVLSTASKVLQVILFGLSQFISNIIIYNKDE